MVLVYSACVLTFYPFTIVFLVSLRPAAFSLADKIIIISVYIFICHDNQTQLFRHPAGSISALLRVVQDQIGVDFDISAFILPKK